jgi:divalent metal cation (Fe/Co/Zn/Cd) transporter
VADFVQIGVGQAEGGSAKPRATVLWLQGITLAWMLVEFGVAAYAAATAHSPALLAFGSDSLVELLSATVVVLQWVPKVTISERRASRAAGGLLFVLAGMVAAIAVASFALHVRPETSCAGIAITVAALIAMPVLAALKRREARRSGNAALAADAVQSATCAYLAGITLAGLALNAAFHIAWFDSLAALAAVPLLLKEGRSAWRGQACACC